MQPQLSNITPMKTPSIRAPGEGGLSGSHSLAWRRAPGGKAWPPQGTTLAQAAHRMAPHWVFPLPKGIPGFMASLFCWGIPQRPSLHCAGGVTETPAYRAEPITSSSPGHSPCLCFLQPLLSTCCVLLERLKCQAPCPLWLGITAHLALEKRFCSHLPCMWAAPPHRPMAQPGPGCNF